MALLIFGLVFSWSFSLFTYQVANENSLFIFLAGFWGMYIFISYSGIHELERGNYTQAIIIILLNLLFSLAGLWFGYYIKEIF